MPINYKCTACSVEVSIGYYHTFDTDYMHCHTTSCKNCGCNVHIKLGTLMKLALEKVKRFDLTTMDKENQELFTHIIENIRKNGDLPHLVGLQWDGETLKHEMSLVVSEENAEISGLLSQLTIGKVCCQKSEFWNEDDREIFCYKCKTVMSQTGMWMT